MLFTEDCGLETKLVTACLFVTTVTIYIFLTLRHIIRLFIGQDRFSFVTEGQCLSFLFSDRQPIGYDIESNILSEFPSSQPFEFHFRK